MFVKQLNEGFNLTFSNGTYYVEMTNLHQNGVDTSITNNP